MTTPVAPHRSPRHRARRRAHRPMRGLAVLALGIPLGLLACGTLVWQASYAAFSDQTSNVANAWSSGTVSVWDDDGSGPAGAGAGAAMFAVTGLRPGSTGSTCIGVNYTGNLPATVKLHATQTGDAGLAGQLTLTVEEGTGGGFSSCTGFSASSTPFTGSLATLATTHANFATGLGAWAPTGTQSRTYRITWTLHVDAPNTTQGKTAGAAFTWEARST